MSAAPIPMRAPAGRLLARLETPAAAAVAACGALTATGWLLGDPRLLKWAPGAPMVFSVALALLVVSSLVLLRVRLARSHRMMSLHLCAVLVFALGLGIALEWLLRIDLGIDFAQLHVSIQGGPHPGRPGPGIALSLMVLGAALAAQSFAHHLRARVLALYGFACFGMLGAAALLAQAFGLRLTLGGDDMPGVSSLTAGCQILLSVALVASWRSPARKELPRVSEAQQLGIWAMSVLVLATSAVTLGALAVMQHQIQSEQRRVALSLIQVRQRAMTEEIEHARHQAAAMADTLRALAQAAAAKHGGGADPAGAALADALLEHPSLWHDTVSLRLLDRSGAQLAAIGPAQETHTQGFALDSEGNTELLRSPGGLTLRTRVKLDAQGHQLLARLSLRRMAQLLSAPPLWPGQQSMLCRGVDARDLQCLSGEALDGPADPRFLAQAMNPLDLGKASAAGLMYGVTWHGQPGMLAWAPLGASAGSARLLLVVPSDQVVQPVRSAVARLSGLFLLIIGAGTWALRELIYPLSLRLDEALRDAQRNFEQFQAAADTAQEALGVFEAVRAHDGRVRDFRISYVNAAAAANLNSTPDELIGRSLLEAYGTAENGSQLFERFSEVLRSGRPQEVESPCVGHGCDDKWLRRYIMRSGDGVFVIAHDITEARRNANAMASMALRDTLTGVANRHHFEQALKQACANAARDGGAVAVVFCDADDFKLINDQRGHECGDEALRELARTLRSAVRHDDLVARLGGDEFVVLLRLQHEREAQDVVRNLRAALDHEVLLGDTPYMLRTSLGWAAASGAQAQPRQLLRAADEAMYLDKQRRKAAQHSAR